MDIARILKVQTKEFMSHSQFLTLDSSKKPVVRKGVNYQSYIPPILPGSVPPASRASDLRKVQASLENRIGSTLDKVSRTLPEMGPFNKIAPEMVKEYFNAMTVVASDGMGSEIKSGSYWDEIEESLDKIVKRESEEGTGRSASAFSVDSLRGLLSRLEAWNSRAIIATLGVGQVLCAEVDSLLEEARLISVHVELPGEVLTKLRILQRAGLSFADQVRSKLALKGKEKVPLKVLTDLMREAEALPIETEEVRFFRNQRGRIQSICHSAQKATKDKSLEKCRDVTVEAAEVRAILPDLDFLKEQVSIGEWVQKAVSKVDKRGTVPLQTIEQLLDDPSAALIRPEECKVMADLKFAMEAAKSWQAKTQKVLSGVPEGRSRRMPTIEQLQQLQEEHSNLPKICVPALSSNIEGIVRRARAWIKKQERTLSGTWALGDAKNLLDEGRLISHQVDLHPELGQLESEVAKAEDWCVSAKRLIASLALTEIDQIEPLVTSSFKAPDSTESVTESMEDTEFVPPSASSNKRTRAFIDEPGFTGRLGLSGKELQGLKSYEGALAELAKSLVTVQAYVVPLLMVGKLPTQDQLDALKASLGMVRDPTLEDDIVQLFDGAQKWSEKANCVLSVPFPRPVGVLRALTQIIHELVVCPMRYRDWDRIVAIAAEELWAHEVRFATLPIGELKLVQLISSFPAESPSTPVGSADEPSLASLFATQQDAWMKEVLGATHSETSPLKMLQLLRQMESIYKTQYATECVDLLSPRRSPMHTRAEAEFFLQKLVSSKLFQMPSLMVKVENALMLNDTFETASRTLAERLAQDFVQEGKIEKHLFSDLLDLLQSVESAELLVAHFDAFFTPMVGKLLQYQAKTRALFRWDADEVVTDPSFRPSLADVCEQWEQIVEEASGRFKLSEQFLTEVAYLASAHRALIEALDWRELLQDSLNRGIVISLASMKKHFARWPQLAVEVPTHDLLTPVALLEMDEWLTQVANVVTSRSRHKVRCSIPEAELLVSTASSLVTRSEEFQLLEGQLGTTRELQAAAVLAIEEAKKCTGDEAEEAVVVAELARLARECRKGAIAAGAEELLENEMRTISINRTLTRVLARPHVVPADLIDSFLAVLAEEEGAAPRLVAAAREKLVLTIGWQAGASKLVALFPENKIVGKKNALSSASATPTARQGLLGLEQLLLAALNAPPTAAGEKNVDMMLRNLDRDFPGGLPAPDTAVREYAFPLPLYEVPTDMPSLGDEQATVTKGRSSRPARSVTENPLLRKGLNSLQLLLFQVPWTRAGQGYLSPLNEVLHGRPAEWLAAEKAALKARISEPGPVLVDGLALLLAHKQGSFFQTTDFVKLRGAAAAALRAVKACLSRFPFLQDSDVPTEVWETSGGEVSPIEAKEEIGELDLVTHLLALEGLALQVPTKYRLLLQMLDMYDWRVRAQSVCHYMQKEARPRPWAGDQRSLTWWNQAPGPQSVFAGQTVPASIAGDPLCLHVAPTQPPVDFIVCAMHMSFYYVVESIRHFVRVMSDMCELCFAVSTTESAPLWIACDACDKWFHGACVGLAKEPAQFTCPNCVLANPEASLERKRGAETLLRSLPPRRFTPIPQQLRIEAAQSLMGEAQQLPVVLAMNLQEVAMFKRFL